MDHTWTNVANVERLKPNYLESRKTSDKPRNEQTNERTELFLHICSSLRGRRLHNSKRSTVLFASFIINLRNWYFWRLYMTRGRWLESFLNNISSRSVLICRHAPSSLKKGDDYRRWEWYQQPIREKHTQWRRNVHYFSSKLQLMTRLIVHCDLLKRTIRLIWHHLLNEEI